MIDEARGGCLWRERRGLVQANAKLEGLGNNEVATKDQLPDSERSVNRERKRERGDYQEQYVLEICRSRRHGMLAAW